MLVVIESPYHGRGPWPLCLIGRFLNIRYARRCMADSLRRGESPFVAHLLYPQVLNEDKPEDRETGIHCAMRWLEVASLVVVYIDRGITPGMKIGIRTAEENGIPVIYRKLREAISDAR